jgi:hypothetical protein
MLARNGEMSRKPGTIDRRAWLRRTVASMAVITGWAAAARSAPAPDRGGKDVSQEEEAELKAAEEKLRQAGIGPLGTVRSTHYQAIGDASDQFMRMMLADYERLALDYHGHFSSRGFDVHLPDRRLILVTFHDDRSFGKFFRLPSLLEARERGRVQPDQPAILSGVYMRSTNWLNIFDWRHVPIASRAGHSNMMNLAHEGTHQLTFNTGLLNRTGDVPQCIGEGLGTYGEPRQVTGPTEFGRLNLLRLVDLAKVQRKFPWIPLRELFTSDSLFHPGSGRRSLLGYAQSWLLVYYLMKEPEALPKFRDYLKAIKTRTKPDHRLEDAQSHLGNLEALDRELRRYAVWLQMSV